MPRRLRESLLPHPMSLLTADELSSAVRLLVRYGSMAHLGIPPTVLVMLSLALPMTRRPRVIAALAHAATPTSPWLPALLSNPLTRHLEVTLPLEASAHPPVPTGPVRHLPLEGLMPVLPFVTDAATWARTDLTDADWDEAGLDVGTLLHGSPDAARDALAELAGGPPELLQALARRRDGDRRALLEVSWADVPRQWQLQALAVYVTDLDDELDEVTDDVLEALIRVEDVRGPALSVIAALGAALA